MKITFDPAKREKTRTERGLDFLDAAKVFGGRTATLTDDRADYGEVRFQTYGFLGARVVLIVWTSRGEARHVHIHEVLS
ncbi:BrnT family toxin [Jiella sp. M17.18]|uniref:BrnT family toxin n=1 Tax=Jiella sp. M17.18 TaxID=3234247 RepID=UPI0034DED3E5